MAARIARQFGEGIYAMKTDDNTAEVLDMLSSTPPPGDRQHVALDLPAYQPRPRSHGLFRSGHASASHNAQSKQPCSSDAEEATGTDILASCLPDADTDPDTDANSGWPKGVDDRLVKNMMLAVNQLLTSDLAKCCSECCVAWAMECALQWWLRICWLF